MKRHKFTKAEKALLIEMRNAPRVKPPVLTVQSLCDHLNKREDLPTTVTPDWVYKNQELAARLALVGRKPDAGPQQR